MPATRKMETMTAASSTTNGTTNGTAPSHPTPSPWPLSTSTSSTSITSTSTPPFYRKKHATRIEKVRADAIHFTPSVPPLHPYDNPTLTINDPLTLAAINSASALLRAGDAISFPTETVYGLGADATRTSAVQLIFSAKSRPIDNPLIVHISSLQQLREILPPASAPGEDPIPAVYGPLIDAFWPGPLTILLPLPTPSPLSPNVTATQPTFAARMPNHPIALALCKTSSLPLAAPSANASGRPSPTTAAHVFHDLQSRIPLIIDGGPASVGLESTVVDGLHLPPTILRPGGVSAEQIRALGGVWGDTVVASHADDNSGAPRAPGMKYQHYSPRAVVILYEVGAKGPGAKELYSLHTPNRRVGVLRTRTWVEGEAEKRCKEAGLDVVIIEHSLGVDGAEISKELFGALRKLDEEDADVIYVEGIEEKDEGLAVMNRLGKAASVVVRCRSEDD